MLKGKVRVRISGGPLQKIVFLNMQQNRIIVELERRGKEAGSGSLASKLSTLADTIINTAWEHQKRVVQVMPEFDLHDGNHLAMVFENMASLIGDERIKTLSNVEIFLLISAAYLHDSGMAPAEWEQRLLQLTEGTDVYCECEGSACNDGKSPFTHTVAQHFIEKNKQKIYAKYEGDVQNWLFSENNEKDFVEALASLLIDYQIFRNGYVAELKACQTPSDFKKLNNGIRIDYIRIRHPQTSARYIRNAAPLFYNIIGEAWTEKMAHDLAAICQAHGEDLDFVKEKLSTDARYCPNENANLQFVTMMLRMGDICHYSFDRAPLVIRNAKVFQSDYSYREWAVKAASVKYEINNNIIRYYAYCDTPERYYKLQCYLDWIDKEINYFCNLQRLWESKYQLSIKDVDRTGVNYDENKFKPVVGKQFTLQQNKIIKLLMGVGLYKDPYASLRELYQNAMDACKCMLHKEQALGREYHGLIEFGLESDEANTYLYCSDNGVGMTDYVIENYLLKIGNSYYKSSDFYREQATWNTDFVPTSQFGIGILSCFMIADRIEILTKTIDAKEVLACCIDGPQEYFYYRTLSEPEKERIMLSGTVVKLALKSKFAAKLNNVHIDKLGLVLQYHRDNMLRDEFSSYNALYDNWENNIYKKINSIVVKTPANIDVICRCKDGETMPIYNKPFALKVGDLGITNDDRDFINALIYRHMFMPDGSSLVDVQDFLQHYSIHVEVSGIEYDALIALPLPGMQALDDDTALFRLLKVTGSRISVDGVSVDDRQSRIENFYYSLLTQNGSINYTGDFKPKLSVDRQSIIEYHKGDEPLYKQIALDAIKQLVSIAQDHIEKYDLSGNSAIVNLIWKYVFDRMHMAEVLFVNYLAGSKLGEFDWPGLASVMKQEMTISDFMKAQKLEITGYDYHRFDLLTSKLVIAKLFAADEISVDGDNNMMIQGANGSKLPENEGYFHSGRYLVPVPDDCECFKEYDIISNLYPLVPERVIESLVKYQHFNTKIKGTRAYRVEAFANNYVAFFDQDSRLIHPVHGLYTAERNLGRKPETLINAFYMRRSGFQFFDFGYDGMQDKKGMMMLAYVAPRELSPRDIEELEKYKESDTAYYQGVKEGWTLLVTAMTIDNVVVMPGKTSRQEMLDKLSPEFWNEYKDYEFRFLDGFVVSKKR